MLMLCTHPCIRHADGCPNPLSQLREVEGGNFIGVVLVATANTSEEVLVPVIFVDSSASWTSLGSIGRINTYYLNSFVSTLVSNQFLEPAEGPGVESVLVVLPVLHSVSDSIKFLHDNVIPLAEGVDESSTDGVQHIINPPVLPSRQQFKPPLRTGGALALEGASKLSEVLPPVFDFTTFDGEAVGSYQQVVNPYINTHRIITSGFGDFMLDGDMEVEALTPLPVNEPGIPDLVLQQLLLIVSNVEEWLNSFIYSGNGCSEPILTVPEKSEQSFIQVYRKLLELMLFLPVGFVGFTDSISGSHSKVSRKIKSFSHIIIGEVVQRNSVITTIIPRNLTNVVAGTSKVNNSIHQLGELIFGCIKLTNHSLGSFHQNSYRKLRFKKLMEVRRRSPPTAKACGFPTAEFL